MRQEAGMLMGVGFELVTAAACVGALCSSSGGDRPPTTIAVSRQSP